jgi:hypothetical protein
MEYSILKDFGAVSRAVHGLQHFVRRRIVSGGFPSSICGIVRGALSKSDLTRIWISALIEVLEANCFYSCKALRAVVFETDSQLKRIEESVFHDCSSLCAIFIPPQVESLPKSCFQSCASLADLRFDKSSRLQLIGDSAFRDCTSVTAVVLPRSVEILSKNCFAGCANLIDLSFDSGSALKRIEDCAFMKCASLSTFRIPARVEFVGGSAFGGSPLDHFFLDSHSTHFSVSNGILYNSSKRVFIAHADFRHVVLIEDFVEILGRGCFSHTIAI